MVRVRIMSTLLLQTLTSFFATLIAVALLSRVAPALGLTDKPSSRKRHRGQVPVVGGVSIFIALSIAGTLWGEAHQSLITVNGNDALWVFMLCGAFLVFTGILDDRFQLGIFVRVLSEVMVAIAVIEFLDLQVAHLGDIFAVGMITIDPVLAYPFTVIAIFGIINAFNMLDGMDGLLGSLVITTLVMFHLFTGTEPGFVSLAIGSALCAFLVSNLDLSPIVPKTFLGDAGSKLLGFIVVCLLLAAASSQVGAAKLIQPVTALFIVALPLYDMVFTSLRRIIRKGSSFTGDRSHIHHLMQNLQFSDRRALVLILSIHLTMTFIGLMLHRANAPEYYQLAIFFGCFGLYGLLSSQLWLVAKRLDALTPSMPEQLPGAALASSDTTTDSGRQNITPMRK